MTSERGTREAILEDMRFIQDNTPEFGAMEDTAGAPLGFPPGFFRLMGHTCGSLRFVGAWVTVADCAVAGYHYVILTHSSDGVELIAAMVDVNCEVVAFGVLG